MLALLTLVYTTTDIGTLYTRSLFYKGQRENETSPSLSKICLCHCCIYDVIASLLLNKAPKIETSVPYKGVPYKINCVYSYYGHNILLVVVLGARSRGVVACHR